MDGDGIQGGANHLPDVGRAGDSMGCSSGGDPRCLGPYWEEKDYNNAGPSMAGWSIVDL